MMKAAKIVAGKSKIIAVTVLTSIAGNHKKKVVALAQDAVRAGVDGIVCSAHELKYLKNIKLLKIVPGIRPKWYKIRDDQRRSATPQEALLAGADYLVIGRPITYSRNPLKAFDDL